MRDSGDRVRRHPGLVVKDSCRLRCRGEPEHGSVRRCVQCGDGGAKHGRRLWVERCRFGRPIEDLFLLREHRFAGDMRATPVAYRKGRGSRVLRFVEGCFRVGAACDWPLRSAYLRRLRQAPWEVDPAASPLVGEPGSARYGLRSITRSITRSASGAQCLPAPYAHATASATHKIGSSALRRWSNLSIGSGARFRRIVR
jgi:hypothetical protein